MNMSQFIKVIEIIEEYEGIDFYDAWKHILTEEQLAIFNERRS